MRERTQKRNARVRGKHDGFSRFRTRKHEAFEPTRDRVAFNLPRWVPVAASLTLVIMITATVNFRAFKELQQEQQQNVELNQQVQQMNQQNLGLQEEIYYLKNDPDTIEREAKRYGLVRPQKQVSRAGDVDKAEESTNRQTPTR